MVNLSSKDMARIARRSAVVGRERAIAEVVAEKTEAHDKMMAIMKEQRMAEDARRIETVDRWPMSHLPLKTQPWITNAEGRMRFALIHCTDLLTVIEEGKAPVTFKSIAEIVETWSVD